MWDLHLKASIACLLPSIPITTVRSLSAISLDVCTECREGAQTAEETAYYSFFIILLSSNTAQCTACLRQHTYTYIIRIHTCTQTVSPASALILIRRAKKHFSRVFSSPFFNFFLSQGHLNESRIPV